MSVLITAETPSSEPVNLAAELARDRAIVVAVGTVGMDFQRKLYYEKELDFRISRSYGPGRYDAAYEQKGRDYPIGHVRWTETRNMEAFLQLIADGKLDIPSLITHRFPMEEATRAYGLITGSTGEFFLGVMIQYPENEFGSCTDFGRKNCNGDSSCCGGFARSGRSGRGKFRAEYAIASTQRDTRRLSGRCLQCDRAAQPECSGEIWLLVLYELGSRTSAGSENQRRGDCHTSSSARQSDAGRTPRGKGGVLRKAAVPERTASYRNSCARRPRKRHRCSWSASTADSRRWQSR